MPADHPAPGALADRLAAAAPDLPAPARDRLLRLVALLAATPVGVTAVREPALALDRHVLDALRGLPLVDAAPPGALADVGAGGGVPGLVLAIARPGRAVHLVESVGRKAAFIAEAAAELGLDVTVHPARSEDVAAVGGALRDACAVVVARALAPPPVACELCLPLVAPGGRLVLWLGPSADLDAVAFAARELAAVPLPAVIPGLLALEKVAPTPARYPRRAGVAAKRPLSGRGG